MELARKLDSKTKEADSHAMLAKLSEYKEDYYSAYDHLKSWYALDTAIVEWRYPPNYCRAAGKVQCEGKGRQPTNC